MDQKIQFNSTDSDKKILIQDEALKKTYTIPSENYKVDLLGLEPGADKKFEIIPTTGSLFSTKGPQVSDILQTNLPNCSFLAALRSIVRKFPHHILNMIQDFDERHVAIKLYTEYLGQPTYYLFEKTHVELLTPFDLIQSFFTSPKKPYQMSWVKLLEKAVVLQAAQSKPGDDLFWTLYWYQREKNKTLSYADVLSAMGEDKAFTILLGCKSTYATDYSSQIQYLLKDIPKWLRNEECILVQFSSEKYGVKTCHQYEMINFGSNANGEFVVLSNPWQFNSKLDFVWHTPPDLSSSTMVLEYDPEQVKTDKSIIVLSLEKFKEITCALVITNDAKKFAQPIKPPERIEVNENCSAYSPQ